jgi:hypothetical protein
MSAPRRLLPFQTFGMASAYSFLAAMLVGVAANLGTSLRFDSLDAAASATTAWSATLFAGAGTAFFSVAWHLEQARDAWTAEGAPPNVLRILECIDGRLRQLWTSLLFGLLLSAGAVIALTY